MVLNKAVQYSTSLHELTLFSAQEFLMILENTLKSEFLYVEVAATWNLLFTRSNECRRMKNLICK